MRNEPAALRALDRARARYEDQGYVVTIEARLPHPFEGFRADAVAQRGSERVIIEVRSADMRNGARNRLKRLSEMVAAEEGWRVDVVTFESEAPLPPPDGGDVVRRIEEARRIADLSPDAAVMLTGSAVEGALRKLDHRRERPQPRLSSSRRLIRELVIDGLLSDAQADRLDKFAQVHNRIRHGLTSPSLDHKELVWPTEFALAVAGGRFVPIEDMIDWFHQHYEPPDVACLFYDSEEGEYMWFSRGPHDVEDVLWEQFEHALESDISEAAQTLVSEGGREWATRDGV